MPLNKTGDIQGAWRRDRRDMKDLLGRTLLVFAAIGLAIGLSACREDEQGRPMVKQKGVYEGPVDEKLDDDRLEALRQRASGQKF